jgi:hypothetical protein
MTLLNRTLSPFMLRALAGATCVAAAALVLLPTSPAYQPVPGRDSGAFVVVAQEVLHGGRPYVDVWDHKGPVLILVNALGLLLPLPGIWGVWLVRVGLLGGSVWAANAALRRAFGAGPAACAAAAVFVHVAMFVEDGNLTEEYALSFGLLAIAAAQSGRLVAVGALAAASFLMRQNLAGSFAVLVAAFALERARAAGLPAALRVGTRAAIGAAAVVVPVIVALAVWGALGAWWEATFVYNGVYVSGSLSSHVADTVRRVLSGTTAPYVFLLTAGWAEAARRLASRPEASLRPLLVFAVAGLPLEVVAASLSGNAYLHYYLPFMIPAVVLVAAAAQLVARAPGRSWAVAGYAVPAALIVVFAGHSWLGLFASSGTGPQPNAAVRWLVASTQRNDPVVIWGAEAGVLVAADRRPPGPYVYAYPLLKTGYGPHRDVGRYVAALAANPPRAIIDTSATNPFVPPLDGARRASWRSSDPGYAAGADLDPLFSWIEGRYHPEVAIGPGPAWIVYVPTASAAPTP